MAFSAEFPTPPSPPPSALPPLPATVRGASSGTGGRLATLRAWFALRRLRKSGAGKAGGTAAAAAAASSPSGHPKACGSFPSSRGASFSSLSTCSHPGGPASSEQQQATHHHAPVECPLCLTDIALTVSDSASSSPLTPRGHAPPPPSPAAAAAASPPSLVSPCRHLVCLTCWHTYLRVQINESHVPIACPACTQQLHPDDVGRLLSSLPDPEEAASLLAKFELYTIRRVLASLPDARWCPAPDCNFAIIAERCERCPRLKCLRPGCGTVFCARCKQLWHPGKSCKTARAARIAEVLSAIDPIEGEVKKCPECGMYVLKMNDGTCNHMVCNICGCEFCWLCMSKVGDMHFLSPSGCTFWGRKPWSRRKRLFLQIATLVGAPVGIAILAGLAVPALTFGIPVWAGRRAVRNLEEPDIHKLRLNAVLAVFFSFMLSPFIAAVVVGVGVPVLFAYVYTVVPVALCRSLESACTCADIRDRLLDCLEGSLEDLRRQSSAEAAVGVSAGTGDEPAAASASNRSGELPSWRRRVRRWLQRLRGDDESVVTAGEREHQQHQQQQRQRRRSGRTSERRRRRREAKGGEEEERQYAEDASKTPGTAPDMKQLENLLLASRPAPQPSSSLDAGSRGLASPQSLRVLVHAEMGRSLAGPYSEDASPAPNDDVSSSPMTAVEVDAPIAASASSPPSPAPDEALPSVTASSSRGEPLGPSVESDSGKWHRSKSLEIDHELVMLRHLSLDEERLAKTLLEQRESQA